MIRKTQPVNIFLFCGGLFSLVGSIPFVLGLWLFFNMDFLLIHGEGDVELIPWIFSFAGGLSLTLGLVLLFFSLKKWQKKKLLLQQGTYVLAEIVGTPIDYNVCYNHFPTCVVECQYRDPKSDKNEPAASPRIHSWVRQALSGK